MDFKSIDEEVDKVFGLDQKLEQSQQQTSDALLTLLREQSRVLSQITQMHKNAESNINVHIERLRGERQRAFDNSLRVLSELERLGLVDLAQKSPILDKDVQKIE